MLVFSSYCFVTRPATDMAKHQNKIDMNDIFAGDSLLSSDRILQYKCHLCDHLLDNPVQAECGDRFCIDCYKNAFTDT